MTDNRGEVVARYEPVFFEWQLSTHDKGRYVLYADHQSLLIAAREEADRRTRELELTYVVQRDLRLRAERAEAELAECRRDAAYPPDDLPEFLDWVADQIVARDQVAGNFTHGLAESIKGRALILRHVVRHRESKNANPS